MRGPAERTVTVNGCACRVWEKGEGEPVGYLAGLKGCPRWFPFLDRLAETRRVVVPSIPGFPGAGPGHHDMDDLPDWVAMTLDLLEAAGLDGSPLIGASVGGKLAAEAAAFSRASVTRLVLMAPYGLYDESEPVRMFFASTAAEQPDLLSANREAYAAFTSPPDPSDEGAVLEWELAAYRASESAGRLLWPFGERGLIKRLHRITCPTLLVWGQEDRIIPPSYAGRFAERIAGMTQVRIIDGAGHLADVDAPDAVAEALVPFLKG